ncbi:MAG: glycosyltransferase family 39 protein [Kiritimatiellae bacterium]|nr:glycosyltransferase family 39 protein [Kiritimatiellia bacterium]
MRRPADLVVQSVVHSVDEGTGLRVIRTTLFCGFLCIVMLLYQATQFKGLKDAGAMDCAQIGRNMAMGLGYSTQCIRPASLWYRAQYGEVKPSAQGLLRHPDILHAPLYPFVLSLAFRILPASLFALDPMSMKFAPEQLAVVPLGLLFTLLSGLMLYLLGRRLFSHRIALVAVLLYLLTDAVLADGISGLPVAMAAFLGSGAVYCAVVAVSNRNAGRGFPAWVIPWLLCAVCCVLAFLTRYGMAVFVPALAGFIGLGFRRRGWGWAVLLILVFVLGISPWLIRNYRVSGGILGLAPYTMLNDSKEYPGDAFERTLRHEKFSDALVTNTASRKFFKGAADLFGSQFSAVGGGLFLAFFVVAFFMRFSLREAALLRWWMGVGLLLLLVIACVYGAPALRLAHVFLPLVFLYGAAVFFSVLGRLGFELPLINLAIASLVVLWNAAPLILRLMPPHAGVPYPPYFAPYVGHVCSLVKPKEVLCSDIPWATAWYGQRVTVQLPATLDEFYAINDNVARICGMYFTTETRDKPFATSLLRGRYESWLPFVLNYRIPPGFPLTDGIYLHEQDQLFLADYPRWAQ